MAQSPTQDQSQGRAGQDSAMPQVHPPGRLTETETAGSGASQSVRALSPGESPEALGSDKADNSTDPGAAPPGHGEKTAQEIHAENQEQQRFERQLRHTRQRERRQLLEKCDRLLLLDFNILAMPGWPDPYTVEKARKQRDLWLFSLSVLAVLVLLGLISLVPALVAGVSFGLGALLLALGLPPTRRWVTDKPSYAELLLQRKRLIRQARKHIHHLEGRLGLASCCRALAEYNSALSHSRFQRLYQLSQHGQLAPLVRTRGHCQLYLMFAMEAEKAYNRLQEAYLKAHQEEIDAGEAEPLNAREKARQPETAPAEQDRNRAGAQPGEPGTRELPDPGKSTP